MTFDATVNPVVYEGGIPVYIDTERDTWNILAVKTSWLSRATLRRKTPRLYPLVGERWETYAQTE